MIARVGCMPRGRVHGFMAQDGGQFGFGFQFGQQPPVDRYLAARQRPGVRYRVVQHDEFVGQIDAALRGHLDPDVADIRAELGIDVVLAALGLLHRQVILPTHLDFLRRADEDQLALARDRVDRAPGQCGQGEQQN